ncbi:Ubiquitin carboxyl-terminal hydrolase 23 [Striga hermonthica]|uniref:Ubiquitin carboxyl-terminal hydrolase n=1 Tax=Striga hermonthica TaxID=68872 RepID=A0A9N7N401_STRHE|nr:Ubiquitin carboxyl-terminal hydrolase 23 [Striga hermonthica]
MAEVAVINSERAGGPEPDSDAALFHRKIEFHVARRPFNGFRNNSTDGFKLVTLNPSADTHKASGSGKKCEKPVDNYETGLDPELSFEITFRRIGAGLRNLGNTCFLNSVLQCLTYTEPLAAYLQSGKHQISCRTSGFCALCAIQKHVSRALQSTGRIVEPKDLVSNLRCISRNFRIARQEDAHEYMVNLLESMHRCCLPSGVPSESPGAYEKSLVHKIFGGRLRSQVKCMQCSYCSNKFDPFLDLSLEIVKADSLLKALAHFTAKEQLDGGAKQYHCEQCKQKVRALKQLTIHKAPHVLTVHLKRFGSHAPGQKIDKKIAFGPTLDLKPFVTGPNDGDLNYTLYGVLVHAGWSTRSGHYYCFVRTSSGMWYSLDDNQVVQVSERSVLEQKAYMLFYVRDRKRFIPRKPVNVIQRENMVMSVIENEAYSKLNMELKEKIQNGAMEKRIDRSASVTLSGRDPLVLGALKGTPHNKTTFLTGNLTGNGSLSVGNLGHKRVPQTENSSLVPPLKEQVKDHDIMNVNAVDDKEGSIATGGGSVDTHSLNRAAEIAPSSNSASVLEDTNASGAKLPERIVPQDSVDKKEPIDFAVTPSTSEKEIAMESLCKMNGADSGVVFSALLPPYNITILSAGDPSEKIGNSTIEDNHENGKRVEAVQLGLSSSPLATTQREETKKKRPELKVKRRLFKCHLRTTSFTSNIIFGVGLGMRKKKLKKVREMQKKNLKHVLGANDLPSSPGPSFANRSSPLLDDSGSRPQKRNSKFGSDGKNQKLSVQNVSREGSSILSDVIKNGFRERVSDGTTPAEKLLKRNPINVMSMLTRGLEETTVARWDGIDASLSEKLETKAAGTTVQIGYVGDEWDEEYDRGKRKKLRSAKNDFSGPNLFQEYATKKSKLKKAKLNRAENEPFRI